MQTSPEIINEVANNRYMVVRLNKNNLKDLANLYSEVYNSQRPVDYFSKKYDTAYTGVEYVGYIAYNNNKLPVAYYGVIPCYIQWEKDRILAAQSADTMTHPKHRFKGMFVDLSNKTFDLCRELRIRLVFGFPNQNSLHGAVNKLGWKMTETMDCFTIKIRGLPFAAFPQKFGLLKFIYLKYSSFILKNKALPLNGIASSVLADGYAAVCRSAEYLQNKTYNNTIIIAEEDSTIWLNIKHNLLIGDMQGVNESNFGTVIGRLRRIANKLGIKQIQFHCSPGTSLHKLFSLSYKGTPAFPCLFQDFDSPIPPEKVKFTLADMDIF